MPVNPLACTVGSEREERELIEGVCHTFGLDETGQKSIPEPAHKVNGSHFLINVTSQANQFTVATFM